MQVEYKPITKVVIHAINKYSEEEFIQTQTGLVPANSTVFCMWCNDIMFVFRNLPIHPLIVNDFLKGIEHWEYLNYCHMKDYQQTIQLPNNVNMVLVKTAKQPFVDVIKFIKESEQKQ